MKNYLINRTLDDTDIVLVLNICLFVGSALLENGAETASIKEYTERAGIVLGVDRVEMSVSSSSMVISVFKNSDWKTATVKCPVRGINMSVVMKIQQTIIAAENKEIDADDMYGQLKGISKQRYGSVPVSVVAAVSCGCFSKLAGASWEVFSLVTFSSFLGMLVLHSLRHRNYHPVIAFFSSAFTATMFTLLILKMIYISEDYFPVLLFSPVLMLVPGYPLVNGMSDIIKGYVNMGVARWLFASLLILSTAIGVITAMNIAGV